MLTRDGTKASPGLLYLHLDPEGCFVGAGFWHPGPGELEALRRHALRAPKAWRAMVALLGEAGLALDTEDAMKRLPSGFERQGDSPAAEALRFRNLIVRRPVSDARMGRPDLVARCADFAAQALPLLEWGWAALAKREAGR